MAEKQREDGLNRILTLQEQFDKLNLASGPVRSTELKGMSIQKLKILQVIFVNYTILL